MIRAKETDVTYNLRSKKNEDIGTGFISPSVEEAVDRAISLRKFLNMESVRVEVFNKKGEMVLSRELDVSSKKESSKVNYYPYNFF